MYDAGMYSDEIEDFSQATRLAGLYWRAQNRMVAWKAAMTITGPIAEKNDAMPFVKEFLPWLNQGGNHTDLELRRSVLLMMVDGRTRTGANEKHAGSLVKLVDDVYCAIA